MVKLLKNEWRRYRASLLILLVCIAGLGLLLSLSMVFIITTDDADSIAKVSNAGSIMILALLMMMIPYGGYVYSVLSYATDIGKKGMIFLTPSPTWQVILSKILFGMGAYIVLSVASGGLLWLISLLSDACTNEDVVDVFESIAGMRYDMEEEYGVLKQLYLFAVDMVEYLHTALLFMASIALARYAANSIAVQVILTLVFAYLVNMIESLIAILPTLLFEDYGILEWLFSLFETNPYMIFFNLAYSIILYIICTCLTDRKVNLS